MYHHKLIKKKEIKKQIDRAKDNISLYIILVTTTKKKELIAIYCKQINWNTQNKNHIRILERQLQKKRNVVGGVHVISFIFVPKSFPCALTTRNYPPFVYVVDEHIEMERNESLNKMKD